MSAQSDSLDLKYCPRCGETKLRSEFHRSRQSVQGWCKPCMIRAVRVAQMKKPALHLYRTARNRAKTKGLLFTLKPEDVVLPEKCPCCSVVMEMGALADRASSPSLDQIVPGAGYTPENLIIICFGCNTKKNSSTPEEMYQIADFVWKVREERGLA